MPLPLLNNTQPCAIVSPDATFIIGGQTLGFENQLQTEIVIYVGGNHEAYIGAMVRFPRARSTAASFFKSNLSKSEDLAITIRWRLNTFDISGGSLDFAPQVKMLLPKQCQPDEFGILQIKLRPGERSLISGMGFPFQGKNVAIDGYVNSGCNIQGGWNLETIFGQTSFMILVKNTIRPSLASFIDLAPKQITAKSLYGNVHHWDINRYRDQMAFENRVAHQEPVRYSFNSLNDAATVITQSIAQDNWWYAMDVQDVRKVKLPFLFLKDGIKPSAETDRFWAITRLSPGFEFFIGHGYSHPIFHLPPVANGDDDDDVGLIRMARNVSLDGNISSEAAEPTVQFDAAYANMVMSEHSPSFRRYITTVALRIIGVQGTRRKAAEMLVSTTLLFLANPGTNKVHASASSHNAVLDFALMLYEKGTEVVKALQKKDTCDMPRHIPLVVRGYNIKKEVGSFIRLVIRGEIEWEMSTWSQPLSPCEWLLKLVGFDELKIDPLDSPKLFDLRQSFRNDRRFAGLRAFVTQDIPLHKVRDFVVSSGTSHAAPDKNRKEKNMTVQQERDERLRAEHWARELIKYLLVDIVESADVLCTTTHMSRDTHYGAFRESAKAVVLTDAGSMSKAEAIVVWGPFFKPCAIGGDVGRKTRTFIDPKHVSDGKYANHYGPESQVSVLRHMMSSGNAMFEAK
ncbi:hypothetical protein QIS74_01904 [Colletotrichum tabaci]|uniref:Uncharacterized protein n=1 Tax=Colletotrichum tabaci TaxID=1209068 RepID=A0AAV9TT85_9PEZI